MTLYTDKQARDAIKVVRKHISAGNNDVSRQTQVLLGYVAERLPKEEPKRQKVRGIGWRYRYQTDQYQIVPVFQVADFIRDLMSGPSMNITVSDEYEIDVDE